MRPYTFGSPDRFVPSVAWRMVPAPDGSVLMVHQRALEGEVGTAPGGYGGADPCNAIVHTAVSQLEVDKPPSGSPIMPDAVLPVDLALSPDGSQVAILAAGNAKTPVLRQVWVTPLEAAILDDGRCPCGGKTGRGGLGGGPSTFDGGLPRCRPDAGVPDRPAGDLPAPPDGGPPPDAEMPPDAGPDARPEPDAGKDTKADRTTQDKHPHKATEDGWQVVSGEATALSYAGDGSLVVQTREPATLQFRGLTVTLSTESRADTGHAVFHSNAGGFVACASCHPEGGEDGRTWRFAGIGPRRTQSVRGGLSGTAPFHWAGDRRNFNHLLESVFVARMSGPVLDEAQVRTLMRWIDAVPHLRPSPPVDAAAVELGRYLFLDTNRTRCSTCHAGPRLSTGRSEDVGTGKAFQVPSLLGVGFRAPFMHDGCAPRLIDRFGACGGPDNRHGVISKLTPVEIAGLVAYLESL